MKFSCSQKSLKKIAGPVLLILPIAVWWGTRVCTRSEDGELRLAMVLFALIGILHVAAVVPFLRTRWLHGFFLLLYETAATIGFHGNHLDEMGGILYFAIPGGLFLIVAAGCGLQLLIHFLKIPSGELHNR